MNPFSSCPLRRMKTDENEGFDHWRWLAAATEQREAACLSMRTFENMDGVRNESRRRQFHVCFCGVPGAMNSILNSLAVTI